ncbi:hypothetical protein K439DRAFT_1636069 [Ramaria rubella]|nr:hypothetical protein K439DRAFT_1636069 [Ramaria rubella]
MTVRIELNPEFKGFVSGTVSAVYGQRAICNWYRVGGLEVASKTFYGRSMATAAMKTADGYKQWEIGPFGVGDYLEVNIQNDEGKSQEILSDPSNDGFFVDSLLLKPIRVDAAWDSRSVIVFTVLSEDGYDLSYDDAIISVFQYGPETGLSSPTTTAPTVRFA